MSNLPEGVACVGWSELFKLPKPDEVSELPELERCKSLVEEPLSVSRLISIVRTLPFVLVLVWSCLQIWFSFPELELGGPPTAGPVVILELLELLRICFLLRSVPRKRRTKKNENRGHEFIHELCTLSAKDRGATESQVKWFGTKFEQNCTLEVFCCLSAFSCCWLE